MFSNILYKSLLYYDGSIYCSIMIVVDLKEKFDH